jgi:DNA-binding response OmpR family regulator
MLQAGESGSLTLPFTIQELLHSLENAAANTHAVISISNAVQLDSRARSLMHQMNGATLALTDLVQRIFMALYQASEHKLDKAALLKQVWGYSEDITTNTLDTHLYRLRTKLRDIFSESELNIETLDGVYILKYACH